ncbi:hypothetical protein ACFX2B_026771 [Malus domestica]
MTELVGPRLYSCRNCRNHVALHDDVILKAFQRRSGSSRSNPSLKSWRGFSANSAVPASPALISSTAPYGTSSSWSN